MYIFISRYTSESTFISLTSTSGILDILIHVTSVKLSNMLHKVPHLQSYNYIVNFIQCFIHYKLYLKQKVNVDIYHIYRVTLVCFLLGKVTHTESNPTFIDIHISDMYQEYRWESVYL